jgi:hypothetical protein
MVAEPKCSAPLYQSPSNVVFDWLVLLLHILEALDSYFGPETSYPDGGSLSLFSFPQANSETES